MKIIITLAAVIVATFTASAVNVIPLNFVVTLSVLEQGAAVTNGTVITTAAPTQYKAVTKDLLNLIASGEYYNGYYPSATFPVGAKLIFQNDFDDNSQSRFIVTDINGAFLCDVSDIISLQNDRNPAINYGTYNSAVGAASKTAFNYITSIYFDNTDAGGVTQFYIGGKVTETSSDAVSSTTHLTTTTRTLKFTAMSGSGSDDVGGLVLTGSVAASGKYTH